MEDYAYLVLLEQALRQDAVRRQAMTPSQASSYAGEQVQQYVARLVSGCLETHWTDDPQLLQQIRGQIAERIVELQSR
jgi:hypothetical protein